MPLVGAAFDLALVTGVAWGPLSDAGPRCETWDLTYPSLVHRPERFARLLTLTSEFLKQHPEITDVVVESPVRLAALSHVGSNDDTQNILRGAIAIVLAVASLRGIRAVWSFDPKTCRKTLIGRSTFPKGEAKGHVITACRWRKWEVRNADEADAACLWNHWCATKNPRLAGLLDPGLWPEAGQR